MDIEKYVAKAKQIHNDKYSYDKFFANRVIDNGIIICPKHGEFMQSMHSHLKGQGCPKCGVERRAELHKLSKEEFIEKAKKVHGEKYDYSTVVYTKSSEKVCIICPEHGEFWVKANNHLNGNGCPKCGHISTRNILSSTTDDFISNAHKVHNNKYDYSKVEYVNNSTKVCIICPEHGEFFQKPSSHLTGRGCPKCGLQSRIEKRKIKTEDYIKRAKECHGDKYDYSETVYKDYKTKITIICPKHGKFEQYPFYHLDGCGCQQCATEMKTSKYELQIRDFIGGIVKNKLKFNDRSLLYPNELDLYIPDMKIAFEFDGLYWHGELKKEDKNYHINKTNECNKKGVRLIHIFEDEWIYKEDIVKSRIKNILGITSNKIYARKCEIKEISFAESKEFLKINHIQGSCMSKYQYGLFYNEELVSVMTFGKLRKNLGNKTSDEHTFELLRFCNKLDTQVIGGASRLLKQFIKNHSPHKIISYADKRWSDGNLYQALGFSHIRNSRPNYFYVIGDKRENRFKYRKDILVSEGYDKNKTEHEIMLERGIYRIYDCGTMVFELNL